MMSNEHLFLIASYAYSKTKVKFYVSRSPFVYVHLASVEARLNFAIVCLTADELFPQLFMVNDSIVSCDVTIYVVLLHAASKSSLSYV